MFSSNCDPITMRPPVHRDNHHQHSLSANMVPSYANRNMPSCYLNDNPMSQSDNNNNHNHNNSTSPSAPRYSPNLRPWRRQHSHSSLSFMTSPRPEQAEYTTSQQSRRQADRGPICVSPFRSVRRMKQPFQLMLPASPACDSPATFASQPKASRQPSGNNTLRTWRSDHNLMNASLETFGLLLPSPSLSDSRESHPSSSSAYFSPNPESESENGREFANSCGCVPGEEKPCDNRDVQQSRETQDEEQKAAGEITNVHIAHSTLVRQCDDVSAGAGARETTPSTAQTETTAPSPNDEEAGEEDAPSKTQRARAGTTSTQASWVPDNFSYCQNWLQGVETMDVKDEKSKEHSRRKFQIVQVENKVTPNSPLSNHGVKDVKLAVASRTKPKLVDISRQSSPSMSCSVPAHQHAVPSTPDHRHQEVSAFSPDTPLEVADSGYATHYSPFSAEDVSEDKEDNDYTDASSMTSESVSSTIVCEKPAFSSDRPISPDKADQPSKAMLAPKPDAPPGTSSNKSERQQLEKWWDHEWTFDQLEQSVKDFPESRLKLTSPVIMFLRKSDEKSLMRQFHKVFPDAVEHQLDCLCASLIARNYIFELCSNHRRTLDAAAAKRCPDLNIRFAQALPSQIKNQVLGSRSTELHKDLDAMVNDMMFAVTGRADETVKSAITVLAQVLENKP